MAIGSVPLRYRISIDRDRCMECGRCVENCPYGTFRWEGDRIVVDLAQLHGPPPLRCDGPARLDHPDREPVHLPQ